MIKAFDEVFPGLIADEDLKKTISQIKVEKITRSRDGIRLRIFIVSPLLIEKKDIWELERIITKQLLEGRSMSVSIEERFTLSSLYNVKSLMELYEESLLSELKSEAPMLAALYRQAKITYPSENEMRIGVENSRISAKEASKLKSILDNIFKNRCGIDAAVSLDFIEPKRKEDTAYDESWSMYLKNGESLSGSADFYRTSSGSNADEAVSPVTSPSEDTSSDVSFTKKNATQSNSDTRTDSSRSKPRSYNKKSNFNNTDAFQRKRNFDSAKLKEDNPDLIYGRPFEGEPAYISSIDESTYDELIISGELSGLEDKPIRGEKKIITFGVYDKTDTINVKIFIENDRAEKLESELKSAKYIKVKGTPQYDSFVKEVNIGNVKGVMKAAFSKEKREDTAEVKRAELRVHTKMSDSDGVTEVSDFISTAYEWGMPGIAITDHGVVQALTDAGHVWDSLYSKAKERAKENGFEAPDRQDFFKIIPGLDCYLVDDEKGIAGNSKNQKLHESDFCVFDLETTGFSPVKNKIIEFGAVKIHEGKIIDRFSSFVNPEVPIPYKITELTSINDSMVLGAKTIESVLPEFVKFADGCVLVGHNVAFDISFIRANCDRLSIKHDYTTLDTLGLSRMFFPRQGKHTLDAVSKALKIELGHHHRAVDDAEATAQIFLKFLQMLEEKGVLELDAVNELGRLTPESAKRLRAHHATVLAKNTLGRVNLYKLISKSHLEFFHRYPLIPKSVLKEHREGLIIGSGDAQGELYEAVMEDRASEDIAGIVRFYDYLEVQPEENYLPFIESERREEIKSIEDLRNINKKIINLGKKFNKLVVANSDAHFLSPEDRVYRSILLSDKGFSSEIDSNMYFRSTNEMLSAFEYLGTSLSNEIVVENPRKIIDMCDSVSPVRPDKCPPFIEDSDKTLRQICYDKVHEIYGDPLPKIVEDRLEKELSSIIGNGFAVMYIIAQKLVWKSLEDGYIVGSRGSVGSSFVAFAAGITEVNALPPHYVCPDCKYSDFESEEVKKYAAMSGCDMPKKICPECGHELIKDGFNIPFETFLGFKGDKEPDIDLNFSGEYQSNAHKYTEVIFGKGQTYRAGTVSALQDKTAYGIVRKYTEKNNIQKRRPEIERLARSLNGVRRGTGQHPGGIIVLPKGEDINYFTPIQHPANKEDKPITTHYDYHSIDHNLLKLDILGHDDPTMVRFLYDATGIDPTKVPLDDDRVMQLFKDTSSLNITPDQIGGTTLGCLGLPEFGTDNAMNMVTEAKPTSFTDLIRISGLSHGTDVWHGNARDLILGGTCTIDTAICNRDDIMNFLIQQGVDSQLSFKAMESVRKGKGLNDEMKEGMRAADVPEWYIEACLKIKYMFPKAHATAYVMNAWRLAWFKVHRPLAFYAAWFSIRAKAFSYLDMCRGKDHLKTVIEDYRKRENELSDVEANELGDMRLAEEMYERGYEFMPLDIFRAKADKFQVIDGKIMPSLTAFDDMGPVAANALYEAAKEGDFLSKDDMKERAHCPQKVIDKMAELGMLGDIQESNQMSLFDLMKQQ